MEDKVLDYFGDYEKEVKVVVVQYFYFEQEARLYSARLMEEGIPNLVSNANTITAFPLDQRGIGLHVKAVDKEKALQIIQEMELNKVSPVDEDFRNADLDDIEYQRRLNEDRMPVWIWIPIAILIILYAFYIKWY